MSRTASASVIASLVAIVFAISTTTLADQKPNIIYIMADDAGYGDLSCYGQKQFQTPNIDRLANEGVKFTQHYAGCTVCAPSRSVLMTGYHTGHSYVRGNREHKPVGQEPLAAEQVTVAEVLKQAGYKTGAFGKWGLGYPTSEGCPINQGFDTFYGYNCQRNAHTYYPSYLFHDQEKVQLDGKTYAHDLIMDKALRFIRENSDGPFFCYLPVTIPHASMHVPESYVAPFRKQFAEYENVIGRYSGPEVKNPVAAFAGMMVKLDEDVGRVLDLLKELGIDENTIVLFTSDNGPHQEGGHRPEVFDSNGPLTGLKRSVTEGGIRVPMLARWPGKIPAGTTTEHISAFWDFLPTCCEIAGIDSPKGIDGISYLPAMVDQMDRQSTHEYMYWEFFEQGGKRAVRIGKFKAIQRGMQKETPDPILLYDLDADLAETTNVAAEHPEIIERVQRVFQEAHTRSPIWGFRALGETNAPRP